jgi:hypothetical protein
MDKHGVLVTAPWFIIILLGICRARQLSVENGPLLCSRFSVSASCSEHGIQVSERSKFRSFSARYSGLRHSTKKWLKCLLFLNVDWREVPAAVALFSQTRTLLHDTLTDNEDIKLCINAFETRTSTLSKETVPIKQRHVCAPGPPAGERAARASLARARADWLQPPAALDPWWPASSLLHTCRFQRGRQVVATE